MNILIQQRRYDRDVLFTGYAEMKIGEKGVQVITNVDEYQMKILNTIGIEEPKRVRIIEVMRKKVLKSIINKGELRRVVTKK